MSRYVIEDNKRREVVVGWDHPMGTYFAQIFKAQTADDEEELLWWVGDTARALPTLRELEDALSEQGITIPSVTLKKLIADEREAWTPGPLQKRLGFTGKEGA